MSIIKDCAALCVKKRKRNAAVWCEMLLYLALSSAHRVANMVTPRKENRTFEVLNLSK